MCHTVAVATHANARTTTATGVSALKIANRTQHAAVQIHNVCAQAHAWSAALSQSLERARFVFVAAVCVCNCEAVYVVCVCATT